MKFDVQHRTEYSYTEPTPVSHNQVHLAPRDLSRQSCSKYELIVEPAPAVIGNRVDFFGNQVDFFAIEESHRGLTVTSRSTVEVTPSEFAARRGLPPSPAWEVVKSALRADRSIEGLHAQQLALPSLRVRPLDAFRGYVTKSFPKGRPVVEAVRELTSRIHGDFTFDPRATMVNTPPAELFALRRGVCQDFAHFAIGCLRSLGLAARYVSGYVCTLPPPGMPRLQGADASHAWFAVQCGPLGWIDFDPTNDVIVSDGHVTIGWGRDYDDICPIQGVFLGGGKHLMSVAVDVFPV